MLVSELIDQLHMLQVCVGDLEVRVAESLNDFEGPLTHVEWRATTVRTYAHPERSEQLDFHIVLSNKE